MNQINTKKLLNNVKNVNANVHTRPNKLNF